MGDPPAGDPDVTRDGVTLRGAQGPKDATGAERSRRYRLRKKKAARVRKGNGSWPPFEAGNEASMTHGATTEKYVGPLAEQIVEALLNDPDCPPHLRKTIYRPAVNRWARAEAEAKLITDWLSDFSIEQALSEVMTTRETGEHKKGGHSTYTRSVRVAAALGSLDRAERRAMLAGAKLGLDPASAVALKVFERDRPPDVMVQMAARIREIERAAGDT